MLTLNKLVNAITTFATNHKQIKSFYFNDIKHYGESASVRYPSVDCFLDGASTLANRRDLKLKFWIMDKVREDQENQTEVLSDTELMVLDLLTYLKQTRFTNADGTTLYLDIELNNDYENFTESFEDNCSGWSLDLKIKTIFEWDLCSVPT